MTPHDLIAAFEVVAEAPDGVARLRELVLQLAVRGRLVPQDPADEPASVLLKQLCHARVRLLATRVVGAPRHPEGVPVEDEPYELPTSWTWVRLGDVGAIVGGGTPKSGESAYWADGNDVPWLTPADMRHQVSRYVARGQRDITKAGLAASSAQLLPAGSILFSSRAPIGHVAIATGALTTNQGFKSCVPYDPEMSEFVYVFLRKAGPEIDAAAKGTTFKEVSGKDVALIPVPLPPLAEQHRIVAHVDELMGLLDRLESARTTRDATRAAVRDSVLDALREADTPDEVEVAWSRFAERMDDLLCDPADIAPLRQAVLQLAVRGRLVRQDPADEPAIVLLDRIAAEKARLVNAGTIRRQDALPPVEDAEVPFTLPAGWRRARLDHVCDIGSGVAKGQKLAGRNVKSVPYLRVANVQAGHLDLRIVKTIQVPREELHRYRLADGDVLLTEGGDWDKLGRSAIWRGEVADCIHQNHIFRARSLRQDDVIPRWVCMFTNSPDGRGYFQSCSKQTTNLASINKSQLRWCPVPVPPASEQRRIVARVDELMGLLDRLEARLIAAQTTHAAFAAAAVHHLDT